MFEIKVSEWLLGILHLTNEVFIPQLVLLALLALLLPQLGLFYQSLFLFIHKALERNQIRFSVLSCYRNVR